MKRCLAILVGLLTAWACHADAGETYYVIQNVETGQFMQYEYKDRHDVATFFSAFSDSPSDNDVKNALWIKTSLDGGGITLNNVGKDKDSYLISKVGTSGTWNGYYEDCYSSTATPFYLFPNPYNEKGYAVSSSPTGSTDNKHCWYAYDYNSLYWLCSTQDTPLNTIENSGNPHNYYHLSTFRFLSFKDLYNQATVLGVTDAPTDSTKFSNYATLVNDIASALSTRANTPQVFSTEMFTTDPEHPEKTVYPNILLRNQRFGTYLAMDPAGKLYMTDVINTDCVWTANDIDHANGQYAFFCYGNGKPLTIYYSYRSGLKHKTGSQSTLTLYKTDEADTTMAASYPSGYFRISGLINNEKVYLLTNGKDTIESTSYKASKNDDPLWVEDADWEAVPYDMTDNLENLAVRENNLQDSLFYRIENQGYALAGRTSGWLSYDDHVDMRAVTPAAKYLSDLDENNNEINDPNKIYAFAVQKAKIKPGKSKGKASANTLWHLILKAKRTESDGQPIGIIGTHKNNLYVIKNANAMQYLALPKYEGDAYQGTKINDKTYYYMRTTSDASQAACFWLVNLGKGQYAIAVRDPHNSAESDTSLGYLRILDDGKTGSDNIGYLRAALILDMQPDTKPNATTNGAWSLLQATFVHAKTATASQPKDIELAKKLWGDKGANGFRYVTAYYPFNIAPTNEDVKVFKGIEYPNDNHVYFKDVDAAVPAFNGALLMVPNTDEHNYIELSVSSCAPGSGFEGNVMKGITLSENGPCFGAWYSSGEDQAVTKKRNEYYIFTTEEGSKASLSLMHPSDPWLMANRVFIPNTTVSQAKALPFKFIFDEAVTSISPIHYRSVLDGYWYNLSGQRVMQPAHGLFIHNGKKILVK